jgi:hypothetical protein
MGMQMRRFLTVFRLERVDEMADQRTLVGRIELHDANVADRGLAGFLLESERQPYRAELDRLTTPAFRHAGLRKRLRDLQSLAFQRVGRYHVDLAEAGDPRRDGGEIVDVAAKSNIRQDLTSELGENVIEYLGVADPRIGIFVQQDGRRGIQALEGLGGNAVRKLSPAGAPALPPRRPDPLHSASGQHDRQRGRGRTDKRGCEEQADADQK